MSTDEANAEFLQKLFMTQLDSVDISTKLQVQLGLNKCDWVVNLVRWKALIDS